MKKYRLITLLSLSFISHAIAESTENVEDYYKKALENTEKLNAVKSETAETIHEHAASAIKKIKEFNEELTQLQAQTQSQGQDAQAQTKSNTEKIQDLQIKLSVLQAELQADALKLQSLAMIQAKDTKTKEEIHEEKVKKEHEELLKTLKEKLEKSNIPSNLGRLDERL
ncbi:type IV secretion system protein VirB5 [Bartonella harrusi]|uniref:Type IV secretion system protein VirB5 n=1 Tax=Bartonella harrusi TaxID=2961895 RepID=A0ABY5EUA0_9HYPH|nr:type IV secretion system protein VirB5 [Bartonella harrusi]UTO28063.1 type IV secretion system protein VirB5 [Bartonella harrusi]